MTFLLCQLNQTIVPEKNFVSGLFSLVEEDNHIVIPHGLGVRPTWFQARIEAIAVDGNLGYPIGSQIPAEFFMNPGNSNFPAFTVSADDTNVYVNAANLHIGGVPSATVVVFTGDDANAWDSIDNFRVRVYAET